MVIIDSSKKVAARRVPFAVLNQFIPIEFYAFDVRGYQASGF
jgi:hypothetical protein